MYPEHIGNPCKSKVTTAIRFKLIFINWDRFVLVRTNILFQLIYEFIKVFGF